jgi:hypothetical protein
MYFVIQSALLEAAMNHPASSSRLFAVALCEWLLVLPPALLLAAAALRLLQPAEHEPARTIWMFFAWVGPRISHAGAAVLFLALPGIAVVAGCVALLLVWRASETLRQDSIALLATLRRHLAIAILASGTLLAGTILAAVLVHIITD